MTATTATSILSQSVTRAEIEQARHFLQQTETALAAAIQGLSEPQWHYKPSPGQWSIAGILEHCAMVQHLIPGRIRAQLATAPLAANPDAAAVDEVILTRSEDRSIKADAPPFLHPTGALTPEAAWNSVRSSNAELITWLETATDLRQRCIPGPPANVLSGGKYELMDGYQWILGAAGHLARHACQIFEIRDCPSFPAA